MGLDAVIATGGEGGGHVGAVPTSLLVPQVAAVVDIPVIAAGGSSTAAAWSPRWPGARPGSRWAPGSC